MVQEKETPQNQEGMEETPKTSGEESTLQTQEEEINLQDAQDLQKKIKELLAQKEHHRKKRLEAEEKLRELEQRLAQLNGQNIAVQAPDVVELAKTVAALKDYSPQELDFIAMIARAKGLSLVDASKTQEAQIYIQALREKGRREAQTPPPSSRSPQSQSSSDLSSLPDDELRKRFREIVEEIISKRRGKTSYQ